MAGYNGITNRRMNRMLGNALGKAMGGAKAAPGMAAAGKANVAAKRTMGPMAPATPDAARAALASGMNSLSKGSSGPPERTGAPPRQRFRPTVEAAVTGGAAGMAARSKQVTHGGTTTMKPGRGFGLGLGLDSTQRSSIRNAVARGDTAVATTIASSAKPKKFAKLLAGGSAKAVKARTIFGG